MTVEPAEPPTPWFRNQREIDDFSGSRRKRKPLSAFARFSLPRLAADRYPMGWTLRRIAPADVVYEDQWASVPRLGSGNLRHSWISRFLYPWRSAANYPPERNPFNLKGRTGLCLAALSWLGPFPAIPQRKCPIVPRPSKIMLSNATSPTGIEKGSSPVRGLWSEPRPLVVTSKLSLPIIWCDRRSPIFHLASPEPSVRAPSGSFSAKTILSGDGSLLATWDISINEWWTTSRRKSGSVKLPTVIL